MAYVLDVMGAWLDIDISGMDGGVCKGGVYVFRMWWCALRNILFPIWTSQDMGSCLFSAMTAGIHNPVNGFRTLIYWFI